MGSSVCVHTRASLRVSHLPYAGDFLGSPDFSDVFFDSQEALFMVYSAPDVRCMAKSFRREGLRSQPELEDAEGPHTLSLAEGWWSWWHQVSPGDKPGDQHGLETQLETWGGCYWNSVRSAEQHPRQLLDTEEGVCLLSH